MADKDGWVYVLTNEAMPGLVKVGQTYKTPEIRAQELSSETGVAAQYVVVYKAFVPNYDQVEKVVHDKLKSAGKHYNKEFFKCEPFEAIRHIRDNAKIKFQESKEDVDKRIQQQKELEEKQRLDAQTIISITTSKPESYLLYEEQKRNDDELFEFGMKYVVWLVAILAILSLIIRS